MGKRPHLKHVEVRDAKGRSCEKCSKKSNEKGEKWKGTEPKCSMAFLSMFLVVEGGRVWDTGAQGKNVIGNFHKTFPSRATKNLQVSVPAPTCFGQGIKVYMTDLEVSPLLMTFVSRNTVVRNIFFFLVLDLITDQYKHFYIC